MFTDWQSVADDFVTVTVNVRRRTQVKFTSSRT